jgi:hypothetical protein
MHRSQILMEEWQYEALKSLAESEGRSISDLVREIIGNYLEKDREKSLSQLKGLGADEARGKHHDHYLYDPPKRA